MARLVFLMIKKATFICIDGSAKLRHRVGELSKASVPTRKPGVPFCAVAGVSIFHGAHVFSHHDFEVTTKGPLDGSREIGHRGRLGFFKSEV